MYKFTIRKVILFSLLMLMGVFIGHGQDFNLTKVTLKKGVQVPDYGYKTQSLYNYQNADLFRYVEGQVKKKGRNAGFDMTLNLGDRLWKMDLQKFETFAKDYRVKVIESDGSIRYIKGNTSYSFKGYLKDKPEVSVYLTIAENRMMGVIKGGDVDQTYFQTVRESTGYSTSGKDLLSVRLAKDHKGADVGTSCEHETANKIAPEFKKIDFNKTRGFENSLGQLSISNRKKPTAVCATVDLAVTCDSEFLKVRTLTEDEVPVELNTMLLSVNIAFNLEGISFIISEIIITKAGSDPAPLSCSSASCMIDPYLQWKGVNITTVHDLTTLWTGVKTGGGYAYGAIPSGTTVVCAQRSNANVMGGGSFQTPLEQDGYLWAHELGHNFGSNHTPGNQYILNSTVWPNSKEFAQSSKDIFAATVSNVDCLAEGECGATSFGPPEVDFEADFQIVEVGEVVTFTNTTVSSPAPDVWTWTFDGATMGSFSGKEPPSISWTTPGKYTITLHALNTEGEDEEQKVEYIEVRPQGPPIIDFEADPTQMLPFTDVTFTNTTRSSTPVTGYVWTFEGGQPGTFTGETPPTIRYETIGNWKVTLTATNSIGPDTHVKEEFIIVIPPPKPIVNFIAPNGTQITEGESVTFQDASFSATPLTSWEWTFDGGTPATFVGETPPPIFYTTAGKYSVTLKACNQPNGKGCNSQQKIEFVVVKKDWVVPTADITVTGGPTVEVCQGETVLFRDNSQGDVLEWKWEFDGGFPSKYEDQHPPQITYPTPGTYDVKLTVSNPAGPSEKILTQVIKVNAIPKANVDFSANKQVVQLGGQISFSNLSTVSCGDIISYDWFLPGATPSTTNSENPTVTYDVAPGTYPVRLTVRNIAGDSLLQRTAYIEVVKDECDARMLPDDEVTIFQSEGIDFQDNSVALGNASIDSWEWLIEGGTPSTSSSQHAGVVTFNAASIPDKYKVQLIIECNSKRDTVVNYVTVLPEDICKEAPTAGFSASKTTIKIGESITFTDESTAPVGCRITGWNWTFDGGTPASSTDKDPGAIAFNVSGTHDVTLQVTTKGGTDLITIQIVVEDVLPTAVFSADKTTITPGQFVVFTDESNDNGNPITDWTWTFTGGNPTSFDGKTPGPITFDAPGSYEVKLVVENSSGKDSTTVTIQVDPLVADFTTSAIKILKGNTILLTDASLPAGEITGWNWSLQGAVPNFSGDQNPGDITFNQAGTFDITLEITNGVTTATKTVTIEVVEDLLPEISASALTVDEGGQITLSDASQGNVTTWSWIIEGGTPATSTVEDPGTVTFDTPGTYTITLEIGDGNGKTATTTVEITVNTIPPVADFEIVDMNDNPVTEIKEGESIKLIDASTGTVITDWFWVLEGGSPSTSTLQDPGSILFNNDGTFNITLGVTNDGGTHELTKQLIVERIRSIDANFVPGADQITIIAGESLNFVDISTSEDPIQIWDWQFAGADVATSANQHPGLIKYSNTGSFNATLTVNDGEYNDVKVIQIIVIESLVPDFESDIQAVSRGGKVNFTDLSTNAADITTWEWTFTGGEPATFVGQTPPEITYKIPGSYPVTLVVKNAVQNKTEVKLDHITVNNEPPPIASFYGNAKIIKEGESINFKDASLDFGVGIDTYEWTFEGGTPATSADKDPIITYDTEGTYKVTLIVTNANGSDSITETYVTVIKQIGCIDVSANFYVNTVAETSVEVSVGDCVDFTNASTTGGATPNYTWTFTGADIASSNSTDATGITYSTAGSYEVKLDLVTSECDASKTKSAYIIVKDLESAAPYCEAKRIDDCDCSYEFIENVKITSVEDGSTKLDNASDCGNYTHYPSAASGELMTVSEFRVEVRVGNIDPSFTPFVTAYFDLDANNDFTSSALEELILVVDPASGIASNKIKLPEAAAAYDTRMRIRVQSDTRKPCDDVDYGEVEDYSLRVAYNPKTGVERNDRFSNSIELFPNPSNGVFQLKIDTDKSEELTVSIFSLQGRLIQVRQLSKASGSVTESFDVSGIASGIYKLEIRADDKYASKKLIVK